ncbi:hypothetical protein BD414DRAFT_150039 [Trametes punicea]|nr:hypothetical protein BD414DRAFT_150039 [Trametes punicea]
MHEDLSAMGHPPTDDDFYSIILGSIYSSYKPYIYAISATLGVMGSVLSPDELMDALTEEYERPALRLLRLTSGSYVISRRRPHSCQPIGERRRLPAVADHKLHNLGRYSRGPARLCCQMVQQLSPDVRDKDFKRCDGTRVVGGQLFREYLLCSCQSAFLIGMAADDLVPPVPKNAGGAEVMPLTELQPKWKRRDARVRVSSNSLASLLVQPVIHHCLHALLDKPRSPIFRLSAESSTPHKLDRRWASTSLV